MNINSFSFKSLKYDGDNFFALLIVLADGFAEEIELDNTFFKYSSK